MLLKAVESHLSHGGYEARYTAIGRWVIERRSSNKSKYEKKKEIERKEKI